jgi:mono/diheme cytochrome c family protein
MRLTRFFSAAAALILAAMAAAQTPTGNADNGKRLFLRDGCWECHGYAGQGGRDGARIAATALNAQGLIRYVRRPAGAMPAFTEKVATDQQLTDIWAYLKTLPAPKPAKDIPLLNQLKNQ